MLAAPLLLVLGILVAFSGEAPAEEALPTTAEPVDRTEILFIGHPYSFVEDAATVLGDATIFGPDLIVFGGDALWSNSPENEHFLTQAVAFAETRAEQVVLAKGNHDLTADVFNDRPAFGWYRTDDVISIVLDTTVQGVGGESCGLDADQLEMLRQAVAEDAEHRILFLHHALFANSSFIDDMRPNTPMECVGDYWQREVLPIISGNVSLVVSGDGGVPIPFAMTERDGIRYVISGSPIHERVRGGENSGGPVLATFVRIQIVEGRLVVSRMSLPDRVLLDEAAVSTIPHFDIRVNEEELLDLYRSAPMYNQGTDWQLMIENAADLALIQRPILGSLEEPGVSHPVEFSIRGNVGNHWGWYKKSWDIDFLLADRRQVKLILPSDRGYASQKFAQIISDRLNVPTPDIDLARLTVNEHDFGIYLKYEDFDRAFIELAGYGSDTRPAKNSFRDHYDSYPVVQSLSRVETSGGAGDRSDQQSIVDVEFTPDNIEQYFERDQFARWLAVQLFLGDKHQHEGDNFRFFLDRSTGRFIMVNWDTSLTPLDLADMTPSSVIAQSFYSHPENQSLTDGYIRQLVDESVQIRADFVKVIEEWTPILQNDAALETSQGSIAATMALHLARFDENIALLEGF